MNDNNDEYEWYDLDLPLQLFVEDLEETEDRIENENFIIIPDEELDELDYFNIIPDEEIDELDFK